MSDMEEVARRLLSVMRPGLGMIASGGQPTLPTPPQSVAASPPQLPPYQQPQGLAAYQPSFNPQAAPPQQQTPGIPPPPPGLPPLGAPPAQWMALANQARTAAFDPTRDASDPNNVNMVGQDGQVLPQQGATMPAVGGVGPYMPPGYQ